MSKTALALAFVFMCNSLSAADAPKVWQGTWKNKKFNTTGPLKCTAAPEKGKIWKARFQGKFMGSPFDYNIKMTATKSRKQTNLKGTATIDGNRYEWTGYIRGTTLYGKFRSTKGYYGEFVLKQSK